MSLDDTLGADDYDEFGLLHLNAAEWGIPLEAPPVVTRESFTRADGQALSYLRWGEDEPELVLLHGAAQNAHTWDTVLLALGRPAIALDLPGAGHSDWRPDRDYGPWRNAETVAELIRRASPRARAVVGMSNGGASAIRLATTRPDLCPQLVLVDVTPEVYERGKALATAPAPRRDAVSLAWGPRSYATFEEMARAAVDQSPRRPPEGVRIGVRHNARRGADGRWLWRYDSFRTDTDRATGSEPAWFDFRPLWGDVASLTMPVLLVRGAESPMVEDEDVTAMQHLLPTMEVVVVEGAGHSVQSDGPLELAQTIDRFVPTGPADLP